KNQTSFSALNNPTDVGAAPVGSATANQPHQQFCISTATPALFRLQNTDNAEFPIPNNLQSNFLVSDYKLVDVALNPATAQALTTVVSVIPVTGTAQDVVVNGTGIAATTGPVISQIRNAANFTTTIAGNTYIAIKGLNLSTDTSGRIWTAAD